MERIDGELRQALVRSDTAILDRILADDWTADADSSAGIVIRSGANDCDLVGNDVNDTITVQGDNNTIVNNTANDNAGGIAILGSNNEIHANTTDNNASSFGIELFSGASGNSISGNTSLNNTPYDMQDDNTGCGTNKWRGNKFNMANMSCIH